MVNTPIRCTLSVFNLFPIFTLKGQCHHKCVLFRLSEIKIRPILADGNWFKIFLCLCWNNMNF
jgi:hypothetical protein